MSMYKPLSAIALGLLLATACEPAATDAAGLAAEHQASIEPNGFKVNGFKVNGFKVNGFRVNGFKVNGNSISSIPLEDLTVDGSSLQATTTDGPQQVSGRELIGATFDLSLSDAHLDIPALLRIDDVVQDADAPGADVWLYSMSVRSKEDTVWKSACVDSNNNSEPLIVIRNYVWDEQTGARSSDRDFVTLACASGAIGSCARWGYRPWATAENRIPRSDGTSALVTVPLLDHHQACIYLKRADYCGDATPHTYDGTTIDVYDSLAPALQSQAETSWPIEAGWGAQGATCVSTRRHPEIEFSGVCQRGDSQVALPRCSEPDAFAGALLFSGVQPPH